MSYVPRTFFAYTYCDEKCPHCLQEGEQKVEEPETVWWATPVCIRSAGHSGEHRCGSCQGEW